MADEIVHRKQVTGLSGKIKSIMRSGHEQLRAVDDVTFSVYSGETLGLVGESGCGKTTLARCIVRLIEPTSGEIKFKGVDILGLDRGHMKKIRQKMQYVFQNPRSALTPRMTVRVLLEEPLSNFNLIKDRAERLNRVNELLDLVGLSSEHLEKHPHELSQGMRQRVCIARALATNPEFCILDEPTSALDVSVGAKIVNLLRNLQETSRISYLFVGHDLSVIRQICNRVAVMYLGKIVELGLIDEMFSNPIHPYTRALLSAVPIPNPNVRKKRIRLKGEPPSPINLPHGCRLGPRCQEVTDQCKQNDPDLTDIGDGHYVACFKYQ